MKKSFFSFLLVGLLLTTSITALTVDKPVKIIEITDDPYSFQNDTVAVEGIAAQYGKKKTKNTRYYLLKGDWGGEISIITQKDWPEVNERYRTKGIVIISDKGEINIIENFRKKLSEPPSPQGNNKKWMYYMIGIAAILLFFIIVLTILIFSGKKKTAVLNPIPGSTESSSSWDIPAPDHFLDGSTIKMAAPPAGTLKLLPGRLEVKSGDDTIKEIRFYKIKKRGETIITFGRGPGPNYSHIQLKPMTVSVKQAKLKYSNGDYTLINYATTNPTTVNEIPLAKDNSIILEENSRIEMGEVVFEFHKK